MLNYEGVAVVLDQRFRDLMAAVCAPVTVVTAADHDGPHGATVSSLASVSLQPPLISIALDRRSNLLTRILGSGRFGVSVLGCAQDHVATLFASRGADRFHGAGSFADVNPLQRIWRDSSTAARHAVVSPAFSYEVYGKALLGVEDSITPLV